MKIGNLNVKKYFNYLLIFKNKQYSIYYKWKNIFQTNNLQKAKGFIFDELLKNKNKNKNKKSFEQIFRKIYM